jgi:dihydropteroate synthase
MSQIPGEAIIAAEAAVFDAMIEYGPDGHTDGHDKIARAALEAAAPILLSHERQLTADAHRDAIVNRDTVDRLERELQAAKADAWAVGYMCGREDESSTHVPWAAHTQTTNPYRSQA